MFTKKIAAGLTAFVITASAINASFFQIIIRYDFYRITY